MYAKIFESIYEGSLAEDWQALIVFQQLLVLCDSEGVIDMTPNAISRRTNIPLDIVEYGISVLLKDDSSSRTPDENGKRIIPLDDHRDWGWYVVNHKKYRDLTDYETIKEQNRERQKRYREKNKSNVTVTGDNGQSRHTDTDTNTDTDINTKIKRVANKSPTRFQKPSLEEVQAYNSEKSLLIDCERFIDYYESKGWKVGKATMKDWKAAMRNWARSETQATKKEEIPNYKDVDKLVAYGTQHGIPPKRGEEAYPYWQRVKEAL